MMKRYARTALMLGTAVCVAAALVTVAQAQPKPEAQQTPKGWNYQLQDGKRVPRGNRVDNPDGSWREELKQGNCVTIKERSATGEYKETRQCNPAKSS